MKYLSYNHKYGVIDIKGEEMIILKGYQKKFFDAVFKNGRISYRGLSEYVYGSYSSLDAKALALVCKRVNDKIKSFGSIKAKSGIGYVLTLNDDVVVLTVEGDDYTKELIIEEMAQFIVAHRYTDYELSDLVKKYFVGLVMKKLKRR